MPSYRIHNFKVTQLWGHKDIDITFNDNVNIIIGPNASGKTTILDLIRYVLEVDINGLIGISFRKITLQLKDFETNSTKTLAVVPGKKSLDFTISKKCHTVDLEYFNRQRLPPHIQKRLLKESVGELKATLQGLVPAVWLPVSRRLPIMSDDDEDRRYSQSHRLESVDECLRNLIKDLETYRLSLDAQLSDRYKEFQRKVLETILYNKKHDSFDITKLVLPTPNDKEQLKRAFVAAGLLDPQMEKRIETHFDRVNAALSQMIKDEKGNGAVQVDDVLVLPIFRRTSSMVDFARDLESHIIRIFKPLNLFVKIANSFFDEKTISIDDAGKLHILSNSPQGQSLGIFQLSSGEKQILILLIESLLWQDKPVVYVADEPELSLHVSWQEKLLSSLIDLGGTCQVIVATHSPDIVNGFRENVINLSEI